MKELEELSNKAILVTKNSPEDLGPVMKQISQATGTLPIIPIIIFL